MPWGHLVCLLTALSPGSGAVPDPSGCSSVWTDLLAALPGYPLCSGGLGLACFHDQLYFMCCLLMQFQFHLFIYSSIQWPPVQTIAMFEHTNQGVFSSYKTKRGTSLGAQWLRICLPMQGTWVRALVREDPTCRGATKPMHHNYWAWALEPASHNYWAHTPQLLKPVHLEAVLRNKRSHRNEKPAHCNEG